MLRAMRVVEEMVLLQDEADLPAQIAIVERLEIDAVVENGALRRLEQPGQALDQRGLSRAAAADDGDHLPRRHVEGDPLEDRRATPGRRSGSPRC